MYRSVAAAIITAIAAVAGPCAPVGPANGALFADGFDRPDGLIANEYATWNPGAPDRVRSADWELNSGSLFAQAGSAWTGVPDGGSPDARSTRSTGSAVLRLTTRNHGFGDIDVDFDLRVDRYVTTTRTPAVAWDGVHVFLRYQSEESLYYASVNRRDGSVVIKKKCPGGGTNGGTYHTLASTRAGTHPARGAAWQHVSAGVENQADGRVRIEITLGGTRVLTAIDGGIGCAPISGAGATGIRGDNTEFHLDRFTVTAR